MKKFAQHNIPNEFYSAVCAIAGEGEPVASSRRDGAAVYRFVLDSERFEYDGHRKWEVIYALFSDGALSVEFARAL